MLYLKGSSVKHDLIVETFKAIPAILGAWLTEMTLNNWVAFWTVVYIILQAAYLARKWYREERRVNGGRGSGVT
jgi:hypothetical protein